MAKEEEIRNPEKSLEKKLEDANDYMAGNTDRPTTPEAQKAYEAEMAQRKAREAASEQEAKKKYDELLAGMK